MVIGSLLVKENEGQTKGRDDIVCERLMCRSRRPRHGL